MKHALWCLPLAFVILCATPYRAAAAAGKPSISIEAPGDGAVIHGSSVTIRVAVHDFKLVPPALLSPAKWKTIPLLKGNQGHIHYILDSLANLVLTRDVTTTTHHTWTNVAPGPHTITAYLANSQHAPFPGVRAAIIHVTVSRPMTPAVPSIRIIGLGYKLGHQGTALEAQVAISHFKLVPPVFYNPPKLPGDQGHIHYVLDSLNNFKATRDAATALMHPWTGVAPGRHTVLAYLATSQHQLFPGTTPARATVVVPAFRARNRTIRILTLLPMTGGAAGGGGSYRLPVLLPLWGAFLLATGLARSRRRRP